MRKISIKRQKQLDEYYKIRLEYLQEHPICEVCQDEHSSEVHHKKGRGKLLNDTQYFLDGYMIKRNHV